MRLALQALLGAREGLSSLAFAVDDVGKAERLLAQRALPARKADGALQIEREATHGVPITLCRRDASALSPFAQSEERAAVSGLDHVVIRSPNPERAIALYAGRLGLVSGSTAPSRHGARASSSSAAAISSSRWRTT